SWWTSFDSAEVLRDFERIAGAGFDSIRIFLLWEAFQPSPRHVDRTVRGHLETTLELAARVGLKVMPTLFTGHMSGVNWIPPWALGDTAGDDRFRIVSGGRVVSSRLASWYAEPTIVQA